ncbi:MAG: hypothetical protein ABFQ89_04935, partial [Chloroflexota bacterium]
MKRSLIVFLLLLTITACSQAEAVPTVSPTLIPPTVTAAPEPTITPLPATPSSPENLTYNPGDQRLVGEQGLPFYDLEGDTWVVDLPEAILAALPEEWQFSWIDGAYYVVDGATHPLYFYDFTSAAWESAASEFEQAWREDTERVKANIEEFMNMSQEELLVGIEKYGF